MKRGPRDGWTKKVQKDYKEFLNNFAWIDTWLNSEGKKIIKKFSLF